MLKIKNQLPHLDSLVEFDGYIPFNVEFQSKSILSPLYWRGGDGKLSLVEIGLDRQSGSIQSITLSSINAENVNRVNRSFELSNEFPEREGLPVCDLTNWLKNDALKGEFSDNFVDEFDVGLHLELGEDYISMSIVGAGSPVRYIRNDNIRFGVDLNDSLSSIDILQLSANDIESAYSAI